jgi:hypothetical protein
MLTMIHLAGMGMPVMFGFLSMMVGLAAGVAIMAWSIPRFIRIASFAAIVVMYLATVSEMAVYTQNMGY